MTIPVSNLPICDKCANLLRRYGCPCESLILEMCDNVLEGLDSCYYQHKFQDSFDTVVNFLEIKGYITSTDSIIQEQQRIDLKLHPECIENYFDNGIFCWCSTRVMK